MSKLENSTWNNSRSIERISTKLFLIDWKLFFKPFLIKKFHFFQKFSLEFFRIFFLQTSRSIEDKILRFLTEAEFSHRFPLLRGDFPKFFSRPALHQGSPTEVHSARKFQHDLEGGNSCYTYNNMQIYLYHKLNQGQVASQNDFLIAQVFHSQKAFRQVRPPKLIFFPKDTSNKLIYVPGYSPGKFWGDTTDFLQIIEFPITLSLTIFIHLLPFSHRSRRKTAAQVFPSSSFFFTMVPGTVGNVTLVILFQFFILYIAIFFSSSP